MTGFNPERLITIFSEAPDPRVERTREHKLVDILVIAIRAVIGGADGWTDVETFGKAKEAWFRTFLELPNGIPSHDTFGRVFARLDPKAFAASFQLLVDEIRHCIASSRGAEVVEQIAIDGKVSRATRDTRKRLKALCVVSAWATQARLVLGQRAAESKSNEQRAIPALLEVLDLAGSLVTIDAAGTQVNNAKTIVDKGGDYVLALKGNQPNLHLDAQAIFELVEEDPSFDVPREVYETNDSGHGRQERRRVTAVGDLDFVGSTHKWAGLKSLAMVESWRREGEKEGYERRYFVSSLAMDARKIGEAVRRHWGVENGLHWVLDVTFRDDRSRVRIGHAAENLALLRRLALTLITREKTLKASIRTRRNRAGWDNRYLEKVLGL